MHAIVVTVTISDYEAARKQLHERVIPTVKQMPGFVGGYWLAPKESKGLSIAVFDSEEHADAMAAQLQDGSIPVPDTVTFESVDVREVAGSA
jgi:hypothetical protein